ncbi:pilus assembly protein CpaF [Clostridium chromiireducens]|jgi:Flp pilus assembly protein, ATPase CpaF|uniref:Pilus assembly protein CpaF n=1 Tax=Clostridium chromiireducens TaxID=225345 RepID=A0A964RLB3_9CLOT|nr:Flp pilus assembly complex ATPase component TadA [Clostridium chromiireducens]MVX63754.1 pilus assembly protein CpaF [Clostridium chromiireducens]
MNTIQKLISFFSREDETNEDNKYDFDKIVEFVDENTNSLIKTNLTDFTISSEEMKKAKNRRNMFKKELELCGLGDLSAKQFIKSWIMDLITQHYGIDEENINQVINFDFPNTYNKFLILLHAYMQKYKFAGLKELILQNLLDQLKEIDGEIMYAITEQDIDTLYLKESINIITFENKLDILVQLIYETLYGLSVIDEIRDQKIDGLSIGVNGIPIDFMSKVNDMKAREPEREINVRFSYDSVWLYFEGKEIWLKFLTFGNQKELERVCKKIYRFNNQRQFSKKDGFIFNNMADFSRVAIYRPPFAESWAAIIRKFDIDGDLNVLIQGENSDIVKELIRYLVRGKQKISITGQQGVGKTTMLVAIVKEMYANITMRVWESFFETFIRFKLPNRNVLTVREVENFSDEKALDSLKKSNGQVTIISEAAEDKVITYLVKVALSASEFILWTHHASTPDALVQACRNASINTGAFRDEMIAEEQVLSILDIDIHPEKTSYGKRYIERITEFRRIDQEAYNPKNNELSFFENSKKYFEKRTGAKKYQAVNLIEFDLETNSFKVKNKLSDARIETIRKNLLDFDKENFEILLKKMDKLIAD